MNSHLETASRSRKRLRDLQEQERQLLDAIVSCRSLIKGSVYDLKTRCGKPSCVCAEGRRHSAMVVSWSEGGRTRMVTIQAGDLHRLIRLTGEYRNFRQARAQLVKLQKELLKEVDKLEAALREEPPQASRS